MALGLALMPIDPSRATHCDRAGWLGLALGALAGASLAAQAPVAPAFPAQFFAVPTRPALIRAGDVDGDQRTDLVVLHDGPAGAVSVQRGLGLASFAQVASYALGSSDPATLALADFDGDARADIAWVTGSEYRWAFADGNGSFGPAQVGAPIPHLPEPLLVPADIDLDGQVDLVGASHDFGLDWLVVAAGQGAAGFGAAQGYAASTALSYEMTRFAIGDLTGDGKLDALTCIRQLGPSYVSLLAGDGAGGFAAPTAFGQSLYVAREIALADVDQDGDLDAAIGLAQADTAAKDSNRVSVLRNTGAGNLVALSAPFPMPANDLRTLQLDHDGRADLCGFSRFNNACIASALGTGSGGFAPPVCSFGLMYIYSLAVQDLDADGWTDVAAVRDIYMNEGIYVLRGQAGGFAALKAAWSSWGSSHPRLGDLDADGDGDVLLAGSFSYFGLPQGSLAVLHSGPQGALELQAAPAPNDVLTTAAIADVNGDGRPDLLGASASAIAVCAADGAGGFAPAQHHALGALPDELHPGDFDFDGDIDLLAGGEDLRLVLGDGSGGFGAPAIVYAAPARRSALADLDADGLLDIAACANAEAVVLRASAPALWGAAQHYALAETPHALAVGDLDLDGALDLALPLTQSNALARLLGDGSGGFGAAAALTGLHAPREALAADLDGDGLAELALSEDYGVLAVLRAGPGALPSVSARHATLAQLNGLWAGDLEGDGRLDLLTSTSNSATTSTDRNFAVVQGVLAPPLGTLPWGSGSSGCAGAQGLAADGPAQVGNAGFGIVATNAPAGSSGCLLLASAPDAAGSDPLGIGLALHVALAPAPLLLGLASDAWGSARFAAPIPAAPELAGLPLFAQALWLWPANASCDPSPLGLSSSRGLALLLQP